MRSCTVYRIFMFVNASVSDGYMSLGGVDYLSQDIQTTAACNEKGSDGDQCQLFAPTNLHLSIVLTITVIFYFMYVVQRRRSKEQNRRKALRR